MALEAVVHRVDVDAAQGRDPAVASEVAADGVDEYLDVFVAASRAAHDVPPGPTVRSECTDRDDLWWLDLSVRGERSVGREPRDALVRVRATAEQLLFIDWGRVLATHAPGAAASGNVEEMDRWSALVPPM